MSILQKRIKIVEDCLVQELDNTMVILNLNTESYYELDEVGKRLWELFAQHEEVQKVFDLFQEEYDVEPGLLEKDIDLFTTRLADAQLITVS